MGLLKLRRWMGSRENFSRGEANFWTGNRNDEVSEVLIVKVHGTEEEYRCRRKGLPRWVSIDLTAGR